MGMDTIKSGTMGTGGDFVETSSIHNLTRPVTPVNGLMMPPQTPILLPANSMNINSMANLATIGGTTTASNAGTLPLSMAGSAAVLPQYPQQPLPPTPAAAAAPLLSQQPTMAPAAMSSPQTAFHQDA